MGRCNEIQSDYTGVEVKQSTTTTTTTSSSNKKDDDTDDDDDDKDTKSYTPPVSGSATL